MLRETDHEKERRTAAVKRILAATRLIGKRRARDPLKFLLFLSFFRSVAEI
jgi:hypothetical protein